MIHLVKELRGGILEQIPYIFINKKVFSTLMSKLVNRIKQLIREPKLSWNQAVEKSREVNLDLEIIAQGLDSMDFIANSIEPCSLKNDRIFGYFIYTFDNQQVSYRRQDYSRLDPSRSIDINVHFDNEKEGDLINVDITDTFNTKRIDYIQVTRTHSSETTFETHLLSALTIRTPLTKLVSTRVFYPITVVVSELPSTFEIPVPSGEADPMNLYMSSSNLKSFQTFYQKLRAIVHPLIGKKDANAQYLQRDQPE